MPPPSTHEPMLNPPRKAKRLRELVSKQYTPEHTVNYSPPSPVTRPLSPPDPLPAAPRRRGRKPAGPMSRTAREQLRKTNHSVIEKRRREKINDALAALRELVPNEKPDCEKKEEKEFKLEILVRTVEYLKMVVARVKSLEEGRCENCGDLLPAAASPPKERASLVLGKRKRLEDEDAFMNISSDDDDLEGPSLPSASETHVVPYTPISPYSIPRLPSISTWMPRLPIENNEPNPHPFQLLSPPQSTPFAPTQTATASLPGLALPSPIGPGPGYRGSPPSPFFTLRDRDVPDLPLDAARPRRKSAVNGRSSGGPVSPWTRDDQTAASLLLHISTRHSRDEAREGDDRGRLEAQTPSSVLGMGPGDGRQGL